MCYKFEKTEGGWKSHEIFRNAQAVDDYHNMVGRMFKNPLFCCEMMTLAPACCRQIGKPGQTYGEVDECNKVTTSMDGGRCKKAAKDGTLKKLDALSRERPGAPAPTLTPRQRTRHSSWLSAHFPTALRGTASPDWPS